MNLELRTAYWDDRESREAFKRFIVEIHNLDFTNWEKAGYWDDAYRPFTYFLDGEVVSSVCIYSLPAVIDGRRAKVAQISGVGTLPAYRRRGVNRELTRAGLQWAGPEHEGVFLFSTEGAIPYYTRCGYTPLDEHLPTLPIKPVSKRRGAVRLNTGDKHDLERIYGYAQKTSPVSDRFAVMSPRLFMFHALYTLQENIWEIPELDCLVCFARDDHGLQIYDILGKSIPTFEKLYPYIAEKTDRMAGFHFPVDRLDLDGVGRREIFGNNLFVKPEFPVKDPVFPYTARA
jgi:GNAT superfamily N-acetyltransferase